jgi:hypothetical protein
VQHATGPQPVRNAGNAAFLAFGWGPGAAQRETMRRPGTPAASSNRDREAAFRNPYPCVSATISTGPMDYGTPAHQVRGRPE